MNQAVRRWSPIIVAASLAVADQSVLADVAFTATVTQAGSNYTYSYTVANTGLAPIDEFSLFVDGPVTQYTTPTDWTLSATDESGVAYVDWLSNLTGIAPGTNLGGFQMVSINPPGDVFYMAFASDGGYFTGTTTGPTQPTQYGDVNADGTVDGADVVAALQSAAGLSATGNVNDGDVAPKPSPQAGGFGDGRISLCDAVRILRRLNGLEPVWP